MIERVSAAYRLNRLFHAGSGRCIDVAVDHGFFGEPRFLAGIEDMARVVETLVAAGPDAIQLSLGQAPLLQSLPGREKPALVLRVDVANVYGEQPPRGAFSHVIDDAIGHAVRLDAACVCVNLFDIPGADALRRECIENITALRTAADRAGMPLMVEPLVMAAGAGGYGVDGDTERIVALVRQAAELGADVIKADPTDDLGAYHRVVTAARVPRPRPRRRARVRRGDPRAHAHRPGRRARAGSSTGATSSSTPTPPPWCAPCRHAVHGDEA